MILQFVCHGQSKANRDGIIQGQIDSPLTDFGRQQAIEAKSKLMSNIQRVYCSPLSRALDTAKLLIDDKLEIFQLEGLMEIYVGRLQGMSTDHWHDEHDGETREEFYNRCVKTFKEIVHNMQNDNISRAVVVSHGGPLSVILRSHLKVRDKWKFGNLEMITIEKQKDKWALRVHSE